MKEFVPIIANAIRDGGHSIAIRMVYVGEDNVRKRRYVSPYVFTADNSSFLALCLKTGELRQFRIERCSEVCEVDANEVLIPMPIEVVE